MQAAALKILAVADFPEWIMDRFRTRFAVSGCVLPDDFHHDPCCAGASILMELL